MESSDEPSRRIIIYMCMFNALLLLVSVILLIGEPIQWESHLQLLTDILVTGGTPSARAGANTASADFQLPVIACNMDLVFMHQACMPRFGHGAFLICLEALYKVDKYEETLLDYVIFYLIMFLVHLTSCPI